jgi:uncharacterized membrane protein
MHRLRLFLHDPRNQIWMTPAIAVVLAVCLALGSTWGDTWIERPPDISAESLERFLAVIASSMLAVTIFSFGITVTAFASASMGATPRATELVMADSGTQVALGSFLAAFIYSVVSLIALALGLYEPSGRFMLLLCTIGVVVYLVINLVLWVRTLTQIGRLTDTLSRIEKSSGEALRVYVEQPWLGGAEGSMNPEGLPIRGAAPGYLTHIDTARLQACAEQLDTTLHVQVRPGAFVDSSTVLAVLADPRGDDETTRIAGAFVTGPTRSYDQDPRFGLIVLGEVGQRVLSTSFNDSGSAIGVASTLTRLLLQMSERRADDTDDDVQYDRLTVVPLDEGDFVSDGFEPLARHGAAQVDLAVRLQKLLGLVAASGTEAVAREAEAVAARAADRSCAALTLAYDIELIRNTHAEVFNQSVAPQPTPLSPSSQPEPDDPVGVVVDAGR